ncbi:hypothetical protein Hanom_Chr08g00743431 [Helianthus anomalus]
MWKGQSNFLLDWSFHLLSSSRLPWKKSNFLLDWFFFCRGKVMRFERVGRERKKKYGERVGREIGV